MIEYSKEELDSLTHYMAGNRPLNWLSIPINCWVDPTGGDIQEKESLAVFSLNFLTEWSKRERNNCTDFEGRHMDQFKSNHPELYRMIYEVPLNSLPMHINSRHAGIALWRLNNGK